MRIGIDVRVLKTTRALARYTANVVDGFLRLGGSHFFYLLAEKDTPLTKIPSLAAGWPGLPYTVVPAPEKIVLRDHFFFWDTLQKLNLDLFFHPDNTEFLRCHPFSVVTVHDVLPLKFPEIVLSRNPLMKLRQDFYFRLQKKALLENCRKIIAVSQNTRRDLIEVLNFPPENIAVIYEGVEAKFHPPSKSGGAPTAGSALSTLSKYKIAGNYLLYLGGFEPHKNVEKLIQAFGQVYAHNVKLVLAGGESSAASRLRDLVVRLGMAEAVLFPGFITEEDLPAVYRGAIFFIYPSLYEGFGFPPLEAMACGTPVIISQASSLPEVGGEAAIYFDPEELNSIAGAIEEGLRLYVEKPQEYQSLSQASMQRAAMFSWDTTARETLALFER